MTTLRCSFLTSTAAPELEFGSVAELAAHIHALRDGRPIVLKRIVVTTPGDRGRQGLAVRDAETKEALGYALIGELAAGQQYDLLGGALARLQPLPQAEAA